MSDPITPAQAKAALEWTINQINTILTNTPLNPVASEKTAEYYLDANAKAEQALALLQSIE